MTNEVELLRVVARKARQHIHAEEADKPDKGKIERTRAAVGTALDNLDEFLAGGTRRAAPASFTNTCVEGAATDDHAECSYPDGHPGQHSWACDTMTPWMGGMDLCLKARGHAGPHSISKTMAGRMD